MEPLLYSLMCNKPISMKLNEAVAKADSLKHMIGTPCKTCAGKIYKVIPMPELGNHGRHVSDFISKEVAEGFDLKKAEEQDKQHNLDWQVYYICFDGKDYCPQEIGE
jgi:hypothetical protein